MLDNSGTHLKWCGLRRPPGISSPGVRLYVGTGYTSMRRKINLLIGLYSPSDGEILLDGVPLSNYAQDLDELTAGLDAETTQQKSTAA